MHQKVLMVVYEEPLARKELRMNGIYNGPQSVQEDFRTLLYTPEADLSYPLDISCLRRNMMGEGGVNLIGD